MNLVIGSLRRGDIVRNKGSGEAYVVDQTFGASAIAIRTINVTNPDEWERVPSQREIDADAHSSASPRTTSYGPTQGDPPKPKR